MAAFAALPFGVLTSPTGSRTKVFGNGSAGPHGIRSKDCLAPQGAEPSSWMFSFHRRAWPGTAARLLASAPRWKPDGLVPRRKAPLGAPKKIQNGPSAISTYPHSRTGDRLFRVRKIPAFGGGARGKFSKFKKGGLGGR